MKRILYIFLLLSFCQVTFGQNFEKVITKDGNEYEGYITRQQPQKSINVRTVRIVHELPSINVTVNDYKTIYGNLPESIKSFFPNCSDTTSVSVANVTTKEGIIYRSCYIKERGLKVKFVSAGVEDVRLKWEDLAITQKVYRDLTQPSGYYDVIVLATTAARIEGQVVEQDIRNGIIKFKTCDGAISSYKMKDLASMRIECIDKKKSIFSQVPLCDRIKLKSGRIYEGIVISRSFTGQKQVNILTYSENEEVISLDQIESYEKFLNTQYEEPEQNPAVPDKSEYDLTVNGLPTNFSKVNLSHDDVYSMLEKTDSIKTRVKVAEDVVVSMKVDARTSKLTVVKANLKKEKNFSITGWFKITHKGTDYLPSFGLTDTVEDVDVNFRSNGEGHMTFDIIFKAPGTYVIFVQGKMDKCVAVVVQ